MNITKVIATNAAEKLTEKQKAEIKTLKNELSVVFEEIYLKSIPKNIIDAHKKNPNYFRQRQDFQLSGNGFKYEYVNCMNNVPYISNCFLPDEASAFVIRGMLDKIEDKLKAYQKLFKEIEIALFQLRTYKRVEENFPEAFLLLPNQTTTAISLNISDLRQKLK